MRQIIIFAVLFFAIINIAIANGVGNEIKKTVGGFYFEFGIDPKEPKANEKVYMSLSFHNASTAKPIKIDNLWVRISKGNEILFTSGDFRIKQEGPLYFGYIFKESGNYAIDFSFKNGNKDITSNFNVNVKKDNTIIFKVLVALIIVSILGYLIYKVKKRLK